VFFGDLTLSNKSIKATRNTIIPMGKI